MRKLIFTLSLIITTISLSAQTTVVDFDDLSFNQGGWNGTGEIVTNPSTDGINASANVCKYTTPADAAWGNCAWVVFSDTILYKNLDSIQIMVKAPSATSMFVKLENEGLAGEAQPSAYGMPIAGSDWQIITLKFSGISGNDSIDGKFDKIAIFFNVNDAVGGEEWLYDNIVAYPTESVTQAPQAEPEFMLLSDWDTYSPAWENNAETFAVNETGGVDGSKCAEFTTNDNEYNLISFEYADGFKWQESGNVVKVKIKAPESLGTIVLKLESQYLTEIWIDATSSDEFAEYTFQLDNAIAQWKADNPDGDINTAITKFVLFLDMEGVTVGNKWYIDDLYVPKGLVSGTYLESIKITEDTPSGMLQTQDELSYSIYPNPVKDYITIEGDGSAKTMEIYSMTGMLLQTVVLNSSKQQLYIGDFASSLYIVKVINQNKQSQVFIVNKK